jgi:hypothetical protein
MWRRRWSACREHKYLSFSVLLSTAIWTKRTRISLISSPAISCYLNEENMSISHFQSCYQVLSARIEEEYLSFSILLSTANWTKRTRISLIFSPVIHCYLHAEKTNISHFQSSYQLTSASREQG